MKRYLKLLLAIFAIVLCFSFVACDAGAPVEDGIGETEQDERKAIHTVALDLQAKYIAACLNDITAKNDAFNGFVENLSRDYTGDGDLYRANVILRVPTEKMDELVTYIEDTYDVSYKRAESADVTGRYNTTLSRKALLEEKRADLEKMLDNVEISASEKITVINEIAAVKAEITEIERRVAECEEDMRYSKVELNIYEPASFWDTFIPLCIFIIPILLAGISIWRSTVKRNRAVRARREQEAKAAEAARMEAQNNSQIH